MRDGTAWPGILASKTEPDPSRQHDKARAGSAGPGTEKGRRIGAYQCGACDVTWLRRFVLSLCHPDRDPELREMQRATDRELERTDGLITRLNRMAAEVHGDNSDGADCSAKR